MRNFTRKCKSKKAFTLVELVVTIAILSITATMGVGIFAATLRNYSRAYLRHLFQAKEMLSMRLAVMHNLHFYNQLMEEIRTALDTGTFEQYRRTYSNILDNRI